MEAFIHVDYFNVGCSDFSVMTGGQACCKKFQAIQKLLFYLELHTFYILIMYHFDWIITEDSNASEHPTSQDRYRATHLSL